MKQKARAVQDKMRPEYALDYSTAVRGKYYRRLLREGANVVVLETRTWRERSAIPRL